MPAKKFGNTEFDMYQELRIINFPVQGKNMIRLFREYVKLTAKKKKYTYKEALFDMIEYSYINLVEKKIRKN